MATEQQTIEISQLSLPHLEALRNQVEEEVKVLSDSMTQLKLAQQKFVDSKENVEKLTSKGPGKQILVPLSASMYVPGTLENVDTVLVDIGTGYFAEKNLNDAAYYFQGKIDYVTKQIEKLQPILIEKHKMRQAVVEIFNVKVQAQLQQGRNAVSAST
ncbi:prefoldin subunit 5 [Nematostella vectensis]|uniref:prefoldin subunit 5 n=1 Tax=Nematostella vectensis TaxID=45351 RepID=UPI002076F499|nr:prefoldin subunit 5 [Nematostella vectensis]